MSHSLFPRTRWWPSLVGVQFQESTFLSTCTAGASLVWPARRGFLFCLVVERGNLLATPQVLHLCTITSAQGFLPPLLLFSISFVHVEFSISTVLQFLQKECLTAGDNRTWALSETARRSRTRRRDRGWRV